LRKEFAGQKTFSGQILYLIFNFSIQGCPYRAQVAMQLEVACSGLDDRLTAAAVETRIRELKQHYQHNKDG